MWYEVGLASIPLPSSLPYKLDPVGSWASIYTWHQWDAMRGHYWTSTCPSLGVNRDEQEAQFPLLPPSHKVLWVSDVLSPSWGQWGSVGISEYIAPQKQQYSASRWLTFTGKVSKGKLNFKPTHQQPGNVRWCSIHLGWWWQGQVGSMYIHWPLERKRTPFYKCLSANTPKMATYDRFGPIRIRFASQKTNNIKLHTICS